MRSGGIQRESWRVTALILDVLCCAVIAGLGVAAWAVHRFGCGWNPD